MAKRYTVSARLEAEDRASREIEQVQGRFGRFAGFLRTGLVAAAGAAAGALAGLVTALRAGIEAAQVQEDAVSRLDAALAPLGSRAASVSRELQEYAAQLQRSTTFGDEAIIQIQAFLAELGVAPDQIAQATKASVDLSSALGISLQEAARNVGKTVGGFAGELGEVIPALKNLTTEALRNGEGISLIAQLYEGRAAAAAQTFSGRMAQLSNAFVDLLEVLGRAITDNEAFSDSIGRLTRALQGQGAIEAVTAVASAISRVTTAAVDGAAATADFARGLLELGRSANQASGELLATGSAAEGFAAGLEGSNRAFIEFLGNIRELGRQSRLAAEAQAGLEAQQRRMADAFREQVTALLSAGEGTDRYRESVERLRRAQGDAIAESDAYLEKLSELGVELEANVNAKIEENNRFLEEQDRKLRRNEITLGDYLRTEAAVARENERLTESLRLQRDTVEPLAEGFRGAASGLGEYEARTRGAAAGLDELTAAQRRANQELERGAQIAASSNFGGTLTGGGSQLFPDSAIANTAVRGGRLVRVLPDGRRVAA